MEVPLSNFWVLSTILLLVVAHQLILAGATIGVSYGLNGDNLPSPNDVVKLYNSKGIPFMRLYEPAPQVFNALQGSSIKVAVGTRNEDLSSFAGNPNAAAQWVRTNILAFKDKVNFGWIIVGNEVIPGDLSSYVPQAMSNIQSALNSAGLPTIKVSTAVHGVVFGSSNPPSTGAFSDETKTIMNAILAWLASTNNPLFVNVHPYWTLVTDPSFSLDYALFRPAKPVVDGNLVYNSLFEATIDAFYSAMEKCNASNVELVVGETGWPTAGNPPYTNVTNARDYNQNLIDLVKVKGTPKRPTTILDTFVFAMFNEDLKPGELEQHWGLHYPDMSPVYPLSF